MSLHPFQLDDFTWQLVSLRQFLAAVNWTRANEPSMAWWVR